jgi:hypothetical protein
MAAAKVRLSIPQRRNLIPSLGIWSNLTRYEKIRYVSLRYGFTIVKPSLSDSVTRSPLYSIYGETISGVTILRAFGASSKFLRDMLCCVDTVSHIATLGVQYFNCILELQSILLDVGR